MLTQFSKSEFIAKSMDSIDKPTAVMLAELLHAYGVRDAVVSPGSRCAPLTAVLSRSGSFSLRTVIDERSAAFVALGIALAADRPVALVCTSGSALMNYGPALAEAYYRHVPLVVVSADRPYDMIDAGLCQTMRQPDALAAVTRARVDVPDDSSVRAMAYANRRLNEVLTAATWPVAGPVHVNMQFDVPLTPICADARAGYGRRITVLRGVPSAPSAEAMAALFPAGTRVLVVAGGMRPSPGLLDLLSQRRGYVVAAEAQANLASVRDCTPDCFVASSAAPAPDVVVTVGGSLVTAAVGRWMAAHPGVRHVAVGTDSPMPDAFGRIDAYVSCGDEEFFRALVACLEGSTYRDDVVGSLGPEPVLMPRGNALEQLVSLLPDADYHFGNGMSVRYGQRLAVRGRVEANRGVSGIDGCTSTAIGAAMASGRMTVLVSGDMGAAYDMGAFALDDIPRGFRMVVIDNGGGDIFRAVATTRTLPECERFFAVCPRLPLEALAGAYGLAYYETSFDSPDADVLRAFASEGDAPAVMRLPVPRGRSLEFFNVEN